MTTMDRITLSSMRYEGLVGASEEERIFPQMLEVDLEVEVDLTTASVSDALIDSVDYGLLVMLTERIVEGSSFTLLEGLAGAVASAALEVSPSIEAVTVRIRKLAVPMDVSMDHAQVEIRRERGTDG
jgi:dihydroneopterin aldolase